MRLFLLLAVLGTPTFAQSPRPAYQPAVGKPHPAFELPNIETGERVSLSDYQGKKVLLFHFASW